MRNLRALNVTINKLIKDGLVLPAFLLKCQIIEYDLKRFLWNYCSLSGNYPRSELTEQFLNKATMGNLISKLNELKDPVVNLNELITKAGNFKDIRNEFTHQIIASTKNYSGIEAECEKYLNVADELLRDTWGRLDWIEDFYHL